MKILTALVATAAVAFGVAAVAPVASAVPAKSSYAKCVQAQLKKAHKPVSATQKKTIRKRCAKPASVAKTPSGLTVNADGVVTALPADFPASPTAADIASLGLTKDSKVSPTLRIPQPTGTAIAPAQLASKVRPVGVTQVGTSKIPSGLGYVENRAAWVEWEFTGGSGVVAYPSQDSPSSPSTIHYTKLNPSGVTRVIQPISLTPDDNGRIQDFFFGDIQPDYGQAHVPASTLEGWNLPTAKDKSGVGHPVGVTANPGFWNKAAGLRDGFVSLNPDGTLLGNYTY